MPILRRENLPEDVSLSEKDGLYAEMLTNGQVTHFGFYAQGEPSGWILDLQADSLQVRKVETIRLPDEYGDPLSQEDVDHWVDVIARERGERPVICAFCEKTQAEVRKLIAGPRCYICNECIELCSEILQTD